METLNLLYQFAIMAISRSCFLILLSLVVLISCKSKKKPSSTHDEIVDVKDFIDYFPLRTIPYQFGDTTLNKKEKDSTQISNKVFAEFVPDSFINKTFGAGVKPRIYPIGRVKGADGERYLFVKAVSAERRAGFVFGFNRKDKFMDGIQLLRVGQYPGAQQTASLDKTYSIYKTVVRRNADGTISEGKDVYGFNKDNGKLMLIMTDPLDDNTSEVVNPIEDLPRKHKFAADYGSGKMNLVSIRDGRKNDRLSFFIHFDKTNGACTGDLKGEAIIRSPSVAEYREGGDPCVLRFSFTASSVTVKELEGCGSHRGLRCSFDGSFTRRKETKPAAKNSTKKNK